MKSVSKERVESEEDGVEIEERKNRKKKSKKER